MLVDDGEGGEEMSHVTTVTAIHTHIVLLFESFFSEA